MARSSKKVRRVLMIAFPGCQVLDLAGPAEALEKANQAHATPLYKIEVVGTKRGTLKTSDQETFRFGSRKTLRRTYRCHALLRRLP